MSDQSYRRALQREDGEEPEEFCPECGMDFCDCEDDMPDLIADDTIVRCWCGAEGTYDELFSDEPYEEACWGSGFLYCHCGGDQCVCHHHGQEIECPGCEDCDCNNDDWDDL